MSDRRYRTARWLRIRAAQLTAHPLCALCQALGRIVPATTVDHVVPHRGDAELFWRGELQSLCSSCHSSHKQAQERGSGLRGCDASGRPLDPAHPWNRAARLARGQAGDGGEEGGQETLEGAGR